MSGELLLINPRKRTRRAKAKRAAPRRTKRRAKARAPIVFSNPSPRRRRSRLSAIRTKARRVGRKYRRNPIGKVSLNGLTGMLKTAAIGAAGALAVDVAYGYAKGYLPASMQQPTDATGSLNPLYFAGKIGLAVVAGMVGGKVTKHASAMAAGSLMVTAYEVGRSLMPASIALGYINPAQLANRRMAPRQQMNRYVSGPRMAGYRPPSDQLYMGQYVSGT